MKIALVHDWLTGMRGGEKVLEALCEMYPDADVFTLLHARGSVSQTIESHPIHVSALQAFPQAEKRYRHYLPFMPWAIERLDLAGYDLVISSSHCVAKGVRVSPKTLHICYCHTPMRYIWDQYAEYFGAGRAGLWVRLAMALARGPLQKWDVSSSAGVNHFVANSQNVAERIGRLYGRQAEVIYPPADLSAFSVSESDEGYYLVVSALVPYKRVDLAIDVYNQTGQRLLVVGTGPEEARLKARAKGNIEFHGWAAAKDLVAFYSGCRALIFPGEEDFGIVPVEAQACGKPVIAYAKGGALETVVDLDDHPTAPTGVFFNDQTSAALGGAVARFEKNSSRFNPHAIRRHAEPFARGKFKDKMLRYVVQKWEERKK